jgi:hypothetical protein
MSIIISNISEEYSREGEQTYEVKMNDIPLATFTHHSPDGMATCLIKAAKAIAEINIDDKIAAHRRRSVYELLDSRREQIEQLMWSK